MGDGAPALREIPVRKQRLGFHSQWDLCFLGGHGPRGQTAQSAGGGNLWEFTVWRARLGTVTMYHHI